jgi:hypothetical protein
MPIRVGRLVALLAAVVALVLGWLIVRLVWAGSSTVGVQLGAGGLRLAFPADCAVTNLRVGTLWEIRSEHGTATVDAITVGTPPPGFQEIKNDLGPAWPATIGLSAKAGLWYGGEIALSELQDGAEHDLELHPIMNELSPARGLC